MKVVAKKRNKLIVSMFVFLIVLSINLVKAGILFNNEFKDVYNIGDYIFVNFSIEKQIPASDFVKCVLVCNGEELEVYRKYYSIKKNEKKFFGFEFPALLKGNCDVKVEFAGEIVKSNSFEISDEISINYNLNNQFFFPLEEVVINGSAIKKNGNPLDGIVRVSIEGIINKTIEVEHGNFLVNFMISNDTFPKEYEVIVEGIEKNDKEEIINYGKEIKKIKINPKPTYIEIISNESVKPPSNFSIKAILLDQARKQVFNESVMVRLWNPDRDIVFEESLKNNEEASYFFVGNSTRGRWEIVAYYGNLSETKPIFVLDNKAIDIEIVEKDGRSYVNIKNIGNLKYEGVIDIFIKNSTYEEKIPINVELDIGESKQHRLDFNGVYNLSIAGQEFSKDFYNIPLITGFAVFSDLKIKTISYFIFFIFIFLAILLINRKKIFMWLRKFFKRFEKSTHLTQRKSEIKQKAGEKAERLAYIGFFKFDRYFEIEDIAKKYGLSFTRIKKNLYFVLFYSSDEKAGLKIFNLAREVRARAIEKRIGFAIALNSKKYENKISFLKRLADETKRIVDFSEGKILLTQELYDRIGINMKKEIRFGEEFFVY